MVTKRVYPDTPIALHYRPFEEIDWCALVAADEVVLVITSVLLREIDDHKDHKRGALQDRARRVSGWLGTLRKTKNWTIRPGVRVEVNPKEPEKDVDFSAHGLEPTVNDDKIIGCMLRDQQSDAGASLVCVTSDNTLAFKAEEAGFPVVEPPEDKRLVDEPDPAERENRQLRQKIVELEKRIGPVADLDIRFNDGEDHFTATLSGLRKPTDADLDEETEAERAALDLRHKFLPSILHRPPSAKAVDRYLQQLRDWMVEHSAVAIMRGHTFDMRLVLVNAGTGNASDIEIDLAFPDAIFVARKRPLPNVQQRPTPPEPQEAYASLAMAMKPFVLPHSRLPALRLPEYEPVRLVLDTKSPHRVRVIVDRVKHQTEIVLPAFHAWFDTGSVLGGFQIGYRIHAGSTPKINEGVLHVKVAVTEGPARLLRASLVPPDEQQIGEDNETPELVEIPDSEPTGND